MRNVQARGPIPARAAPDPPKYMAASADPDIDRFAGMASSDSRPQTRQNATGSFHALDHCCLSWLITVQAGRRVTVATTVAISTATATTSSPSHSSPGASRLNRVRLSVNESE